MFAVDSSAIISIIKKEPEGQLFADMLVYNDWITGAPTVLECHTVIRKQGDENSMRVLKRLLEFPTAEIVGFDHKLLEISQQAFDQFGKGVDSKAKLNFGDCMSYAVAKFFNLPLLYKGNDFPNTDIKAAYVP